MFISTFICILCFQYLYVSGYPTHILLYTSSLFVSLTTPSSVPEKYKIKKKKHGQQFCLMGVPQIQKNKRDWLSERSFVH